MFGLLLNLPRSVSFPHAFVVYWLLALRSINAPARITFLPPSSRIHSLPHHVLSDIIKAVKISTKRESSACVLVIDDLPDLVR